VHLKAFHSNLPLGEQTMLEQVLALAESASQEQADGHSFGRSRFVLAVALTTRGDVVGATLKDVTDATSTALPGAGERSMETKAFGQMLLELSPRLKPAPSVTVDEYRAIECNRCGACCEDLTVLHSPDELSALMAGGTLDADRQAFYSGLVPVEPLVKGWRYRCRHFTRETDGLGTCTIRDHRPQICRDYPDGVVVRRWSQCAWYVQIAGPDGTVIPMVPQQNGGTATGS